MGTYKYKMEKKNTSTYSYSLISILTVAQEESREGTNFRLKHSTYNMEIPKNI